LALAVGFTTLLNALLLATFVFSEWMSGTVRLAAGGVLLVTWLLAWWESRAGWQRQLAEWTSSKADESRPDTAAKAESRSPEDLCFREAQQKYLAGDWIVTEQLLLKRLKQDARDVESRLLLATLWRHQQRDQEALRQLDRLERLEAAQPWQHEIAAEREAIQNRITAQDEQDITPTNETIETNKRLAA